MGRQTLTRLKDQSGWSDRRLRNYFEEWLEAYPTWQVIPSERVNLLIDGTYFKGNLCLVLYRDDKIKFTQLYRLTDGEWEEEICEDLKNLLKLGVEIESITCDGHRSILNAAKKACKQVTIQRCIVHIQRMCKIWLTQSPQSLAGIDLLKIVHRLHEISDREQWGYWVVSLIRWHEKHQNFVNEKSFNPLTGRYWYTHKMVRRSFITIKRALPNMFNYLDNPRIPKSTNGLESFFGHLKDNLSIHRGLSIKHRKSFIKWYLYFKNKANDRFS